jgi:opacity protein-like surface antigen
MASLLLLTGVVAGIFMAAPASADLTHFSLGPRVGWTRTSDTETSAPVYGLATRFRLFEFIGAELAVDYRKEEKDGSEIKTIPVQVSGLLYILPFLHATAGIGWYNVDASLKGVGETLEDFDDSRSDAGLHLGGGLDIELSPRASLTGELRYVFLNYEFEDIEEVFEVDANYLMITAGLQIYVW